MDGTTHTATTRGSDEDWRGKYHCLLHAMDLLAFPRDSHREGIGLEVSDELLQWWICVQRLEQTNLRWHMVQELLTQWDTPRVQGHSTARIHRRLLLLPPLRKYHVPSRVRIYAITVTCLFCALTLVAVFGISEFFSKFSVFASKVKFCIIK